MNEAPYHGKSCAKFTSRRLQCQILFRMPRVGLILSKQRSCYVMLPQLNGIIEWLLTMQLCRLENCLGRS